MNKYSLEFYIAKQPIKNGSNDLITFYEFVKLGTVYLSLIEVIGAVKTIFELYTTTYGIYVCKNGIPFKSYFRGDFNEKK